ncbi:hypothetical protein N8865_02890 [Francisellaceae bacterium]|nr:hypothetical protein [Francisellaceae bacterium]
MPNNCSVIVEVRNENNKLLSTKTIFDKPIKMPEKIGDLGLAQQEQQKILQDIQDIVVNQEVKGMSIFNDGICPQCGSRLHRNGQQKSLYHGVYADTNVAMPKLTCSSKSCEWNYNPSIQSYYGDNISPELSKIQTELGATTSYRTAKNTLRIMTGRSRPINNHMRIRGTTFRAGEGMSSYNKNLSNAKLDRQPAGEDSCNICSEVYNGVTCSYSKELVIGVDGAYIHDADNAGHNFEAMVAKIYNPLNVIQTSNKRYQIIRKQCVGSAMKDEQEVMKEKTLVAAKLEGMDKKTKVIGLADGAPNCWNVIKSLIPFCAILECILDWFHIAKRFVTISNQLPKYAKGFLDSAKGGLWYGDTNAALLCLQNLREELKNKDDVKKLDDLIGYIENNRKYIVCYDERAFNGLPFSSQMAESTVEHFVAERFKKKQKMAWNRENAHIILQVRANLTSNTFDEYWRASYGVPI